jgi:integrase
MKNPSIRAFSIDELKRIKETLDQNGSPADRLLYSLMLTGMRASQCRSMKAQDLAIQADHSINVKNVILPNVNAKPTLRLLSSKRAQGDNYVLPSDFASNSAMTPAQFFSKFSSWLRAANVCQAGRSPHAVRLSVIAASMEAMSQPSTHNNSVTGKTSPDMIQHYSPGKRPPKT